MFIVLVIIVWKLTNVAEFSKNWSFLKKAQQCIFGLYCKYSVFVQTISESHCLPIVVSHIQVGMLQNHIFLWMWASFHCIWFCRIVPAYAKHLGAKTIKSNDATRIYLTMIYSNGLFHFTIYSDIYISYTNFQFSFFMPVFYARFIA